MFRSLRVCLPSLPLLALLAGCTQDPFERPGTVRARGVNDANLRAMVTDPAHLQRGAEAFTSRGAAAADPVARLRRGERRELSPGSGGGMQPSAMGGQDASR
ncbi:hypothetical protein [Siccirubricoccus sp. G192]|uniref:hypothetical protein n=1 Tax=Siccirubricoccus sp. G192 TaxID=2849651 RepID=UPI001C2C3015|nr:hypothetical protein [Siccirubricoccus sp. G192]MBV1798608.1 hypothetical protein [Siccirubricoccus sp. G192]